MTARGEALAFRAPTGGAGRSRTAGWTPLGFFLSKLRKSCPYRREWFWQGAAVLGLHTRTKREYTGPAMPFAELDITSNFTFLTGGSHPEEYIGRAALLGIGAIAIADENSVAGIVRAHTAAREIARQVRLLAKADPIGPPRPAHISKPPSAPVHTVPRLIPAARIVLQDGFTVTALPRDRAAWGRLCRLLTLGRRRADKGDCQLRFDDLVDWAAGLELLLHPRRERQARHGDRAVSERRQWRRSGEGRAKRMAVTGGTAVAPLSRAGQPAPCPALRRSGQRPLCPADQARGQPWHPSVASASAGHAPCGPAQADRCADRDPQGCRVDALGRAALANAEQRLRSEAEMRRIFAGPRGRRAPQRRDRRALHLLA